MDQLLRESKEKYILEGQKAIIAINGGGAVALLAFLQAIWEKSNTGALRIAVLVGVLAFAVGVVIGASSYMLRHRALVAKAFSSEKLIYRIAYSYVPMASLACFMLGIGIPVVTALDSLFWGWWSGSIPKCLLTML